MTRSGAGPIDLREKGAPRDGEPQVLDRRLFVQLHRFGGCDDPGRLVEALRGAGFETVLYRDLYDPHGMALVSMHEEPEFFVTELRNFLARDPFRSLEGKPHLSMFGRTYASGFEPNLEDWLLHKVRRAVCSPGHRWGVGYPLRRTGAFARLSADEQMSILREHGGLGRAYADSGHALDVRLACHGIDPNDNDFVIGLVGPRLHPLSHLIQTMRRTRQTSLYIEKMGPFFIGHALYQAPLPGAGRGDEAPAARRRE